MKNQEVVNEIKDAGIYSVQIISVRDEYILTHELGPNASDPIMITVNKVDLTVNVNDAVIDVGDNLPSFTLNMIGLQFGDDVNSSFVINDVGTLRVAGEYVLTVENVVPLNNYNFLHGSHGALVVHPKIVSDNTINITKGAEQVLKFTVVHPRDDSIPDEVVTVTNTGVTFTTFHSGDYELYFNSDLYSVANGNMSFTGPDENNSRTFNIMFDTMPVSDTQYVYTLKRFGSTYEEVVVLGSGTFNVLARKLAKKLERKSMQRKLLKKYKVQKSYLAMKKQVENKMLKKSFVGKLVKPMKSMVPKPMVPKPMVARPMKSMLSRPMKSMVAKPMKSMVAKPMKRNGGCGCGSKSMAAKPMKSMMAKKK